jgi:two-component system, NtrC family, sensor kinase
MIRMTAFLFIFCCMFSAAQASPTDSLGMLLRNGKLDDGQRYEVFIQLAQSHASSTPDTAIEYGKQALMIAEKLPDKKLVANAAKMLGTYYYRQSDLANALEYFKLALKTSIEINNTDELAPGYNNIGVVYNRLGYYDLALEHHLRQLTINEQLDNKRGMAISYLNIGNIYNNIAENDNALEYYLKSREIYQQIHDTNSYANTSINLGVISMEMKNYDQAVEFFNEALPIKERIGDLNNLANIYTNLGVISSEQKDLEMAIYYLEKSMNLYKSMKNRQGMVISGMNLGDVKIQLNKFDESYAHFQEALQIAKATDSKKLIQQASEKLSKWYSETGEHQKALDFFRAATAIKDSLLSSEKSMQIKNLQIVYEVEKKEKEILEQRIAIQKLTARQLYFWLAIAAVITLVIIFYSRYRIKKRLNRRLEQKIAEALRKQNEQQQVIVHQSSLTSLGELASGIAHEIRQPLQNMSLANESLRMENKEENPDRGFIDQTINDIQEDIKRIKLIISEISRFSRGQQMQIAEFFDVNNSIEKAFLLARTRFSDYQIKVDFDLSPDLPQIYGNPYKFEQVVVNFFNNAKDATEERAEKSDASYQKHMKVKSYADNEHVILEVIDNGIGITEEVKTNIFLPFYTTKALGKGTGLGLSISLGIAKEMGGFIELESEEMKGTIMRLKIPLPEKST